MASMDKLLNVGWFSTARGDSSRKLLQSVFESTQKNQVHARIDFVFCSREPGESEKTDIFFQQVKDYRIPLVCFSVRKFADHYASNVGVGKEVLPAWRLEYDRCVMQKLSNFKPAICVLAGYMLIIGPEMCDKYNMINLHPALPNGPKGTWQDVIWTLMEHRASESGAMMHLVTPDLDRGPVITYCRFAIEGPGFDEFWSETNRKSISQIRTEQGENNDLFSAIRREGFKREIPLLIYTLKAFSESKIAIGEDKVLYDSRGKIITGYDLTAEIDAVLAGPHLANK
jgi:phosphoribosylglycinamide formyltransferase 1